MGIGLAEPLVFIGGHQVKIRGLQSHPAHPGLLPHHGEHGVGGQDDLLCLFSCGTDGLHRQGVFSRELLCLLEFVPIEVQTVGVDSLLVRAGKMAKNLPEPLFVGGAAIISHHGRDAGPHVLSELFGVKTMPRELAEKQLKITLDESVRIHRHQSAVHIKKNCLVFHDFAPFFRILLVFFSLIVFLPQVVAHFIENPAGMVSVGGGGGQLQGQ